MAAVLWMSLVPGAFAQSIKARHVVVYYEPGRFGGWPANRGMWAWGDELLVGFSRGYYKDLGDLHHIDRERPEEYLLARSLDGGETWKIEYPNEHGDLVPKGDALHGTEPTRFHEPPTREQDTPIDFTHPDFCMVFRMLDIDHGPSQYFYSYDRGKTWEGPFPLPNFGTPGIAARTDYIIDGPRTSTVFLTAAKQNGQEGRPLCVRTTDGGLTWDFVSFIGPEPEGFAIMPSSVRLSGDEILVAVRRREGPERFIDVYRTLDNGATWTLEHERLVDTAVGNPPAMIRLRDGRLCLTYGYRGEPWSIRAVLSDDNGRTWTAPIMLRDDGSSRDLGYPRTVQRPDGKIVTLYYFSGGGMPGPERYIAATLWDPPRRAGN